jgi:hypothetical protein
MGDIVMGSEGRQTMKTANENSQKQPKTKVPQL